MITRPSVTVISLGGTISSAAEVDSGLASPRLSAADLVAAVPELESVATVDVIDVARVPSNDLSFKLARLVADEISAAARKEISGVVVTQGTDTIEEMSYCLDLLVPEDIAVVVTGAMRHWGQPGADGSANLLAAVRVAAHPDARGLGALVVLNEEVHSARAVRKEHTSSPSAFHSAEVGPVGWVTEGAVRLRDRPYPRLVVLPPPDKPIVRVPLVKMTLDDDGWWLQAVREAAAQGLVIEGLGGGHIPDHLVDEVLDLAQRVPIVLASRTGRGTVLTSTYGGFAGSETNLVAGGLIPAGTLDGIKSRVILGVLLAAGFDRTGIATAVRRAGQLARRSTADQSHAESSSTAEQKVPTNDRS